MQSRDMDSNPHILIIGAGPAGLAIGGRLRQTGLDFTILEKSDKVASRWYEHYDRVCLHTVKQYSHLPHLPFPEDYPRYVSRDLLIDYYNQYASHFDIEPIFNTAVREIRRNSDSDWKVITSDQTYTAAHVVVATGVNRIPNMPSWPGMQQFKGEIIHSIAYRNPYHFRGKRVLLVGMGNTGAEIALDLANAGIETTISVRGQVNIVPRDLNGKPVQETSKILARIPFGLGDWIGAKVQRLYFGDLSKYGLQQSRVYPAVALKTTGKTPVIDIGTIQAIKDGRITIAGEIKHLCEKSVVFSDGSARQFDHVILATGYKPVLSDLIQGISAFLDIQGYPKHPIGTGDFSGLYFIGFDNYKLGGILGTIYTDSETIVKHLKEHTA